MGKYFSFTQPFFYLVFDLVLHNAFKAKTYEILKAQMVNLDCFIS